MGDSTYRKWRLTYPSFATDADRILNKRSSKKKAPVLFDADFQKRYLHRDTPAHQQRIIDTLNSLEGGEWALVLMPPEHLKTSTAEDFLTHAIAMNPNVRCLVISKTANHAEKIVGGIKDRLESFDASEDLISDYGPFRGKPWTRGRFNVAGKNSGERDFTLEAVGMKGQIYGHRCDIVLLDDAIDNENAANYEDQFDWLGQIVESRLTEQGRGIVLGTRIRPLDLYEKLLQEGWAHHVLKLPMIDAGGPLWPERWSLERVEKKRVRLKPFTWALQYQQEKLQPADAIFPRVSIESCFDTKLSAPRAMIPGTVSIAGLDPGLAHFTSSFVIGLDRSTGVRTWVDVRNELNVGEGGDRLLALTNFAVDVAKRFRVGTFVIEGNSSFELFTGDFRLRKALKDIGCNLWVVTADQDGGLKGGTKWLPDRRELTYESLGDLFTNRLYRVPASSGALKAFEQAINQFEGYPGNKRFAKDIISAARLAEYGCLHAMEAWTQQAPKSYGEQMERLEQTRQEQKIPAYVTAPHRRRLKEQAMADLSHRLFGAEGHFTRRLPRRGANQQETENV